MSLDITIVTSGDSFIVTLVLNFSSLNLEKKYVQNVVEKHRIWIHQIVCDFCHYFRPQINYSLEVKHLITLYLHYLVFYSVYSKTKNVYDVFL